MCLNHRSLPATLAVLIQLGLDLTTTAARSLRTNAALRAENEMLREQLAVLLARGRPRVGVAPATQVKLALLARLCAWREVLVIVRPETLIRWQRAGFRLLWRMRSRRRGRPVLPHEIRAVIRRLAEENPTWGLRRIRDEARLKLGVRVAAETVRKVLGQAPPPRATGNGQRWATFLRNHAGQVLACDLFTVATVRFRVLYVLVFVELGSRRITHVAVTPSPNEVWMAQQMREAIPCEHGYRFLLHDRDSVFSAGVDGTVKRMGLRVLKTPPRTPVANSICERVIGTARRECLDHVIPLSEKHLRRILREWVAHYNRERPHQSLGPGIPQPAEGLPVAELPERHRLPEGARVVARPVLGGLHHEYRLERAA